MFPELAAGAPLEERLPVPGYIGKWGLLGFKLALGKNYKNLQKSSKKWSNFCKFYYINFMVLAYLQNQPVICMLSF
jgi:hypothetical protein